MQKDFLQIVQNKKKTWTKEQFDKHMHENHNGSAISSYLKEIVYGGNDGIVTTFAVVAGFSGAQSSISGSVLPVISVLIFGLANLFADGLSMGLGNYLSLRAEQDVYQSERKKEADEVKNSPESEIAETVYLFVAQGFSLDDAKKMTAICIKNQPFWIDFMMKYELKMNNPEDESAILNGFATFTSFVFFGSIPLLPYMITALETAATHETFIVSCVCTAMALMLLGIIRAKFSGQSYMVAIAETLLIGGVAACVAFIVGFCFRV